MSVEVTQSMLPKLTLADASEFVVKEARLIDQWRLEEWNDLFTPDGIYWFPLEMDSKRLPENALIYDTRVQREIRIKHVLHEEHLAQVPRSETVHFVSNVEVEAESEGRALVRCNILVYEMRPGGFSGLEVGRGVVRAFPARCDYRLEWKDRWMISEKKVLLLNRSVPLYNVTFII
jgi:3-phenylpropionate/cinnamic acid dioxygenase small subunit